MNALDEIPESLIQRSALGVRRSMFAFLIFSKKTPHGLALLLKYLPTNEKGTTMNRALGLACLAAGIILLIWGLQASNSFTSNVSKTFTGTPTNNSMWMIIVGIVVAVFGLILSLRGGSGTRM